jgi:DNA-binding CsgD family transcriptional regulator
MPELRKASCNSSVEIPSAALTGATACDYRDLSSPPVNASGDPPRLTHSRSRRLEATGLRLRKILAGGVDALTPSERRVAEMAAAAMSNREIARALFLTSRTIGTHLAHAYQKLDVRGRRELAGRLQ